MDTHAVTKALSTAPPPLLSHLGSRPLLLIMTRVYLSGFFFSEGFDLGSQQMCGTEKNKINGGGRFRYASGWQYGLKEEER